MACQKEKILIYFLTISPQTIPFRIYHVLHLSSQGFFFWQLDILANFLLFQFWQLDTCPATYAQIQGNIAQIQGNLFFFICSMTQKQHKKFCSVCSFCLLVFSSHCLPMSWIRSIVLCMTNTLLWRRHASRSKKISESSNQAFVVLCPCGCPTFLGVWCLSFRFLPSKRSLRFTFFFPVCTE